MLLMHLLHVLVLLHVMLLHRLRLLLPMVHLLPLMLQLLGSCRRRWATVYAAHLAQACRPCCCKRPAFCLHAMWACYRPWRRQLCGHGCGWWQPRQERSHGHADRALWGQSTEPLWWRQPPRTWRLAQLCGQNAGRKQPMLLLMLVLLLPILPLLLAAVVMVMVVRVLVWVLLLLGGCRASLCQRHAQPRRAPTIQHINQQCGQAVMPPVSWHADAMRANALAWRAGALAWHAGAVAWRAHALARRGNAKACKA